MPLWDWMFEVGDIRLPSDRRVRFWVSGVAEACRANVGFMPSMLLLSLSIIDIKGQTMDEWTARESVMEVLASPPWISYQWVLFVACTASLLPCINHQGRVCNSFFFQFILPCQFVEDDEWEPSPLARGPVYAAPARIDPRLVWFTRPVKPFFVCWICLGLGTLHSSLLPVLCLAIEPTVASRQNNLALTGIQAASGPASCIRGLGVPTGTRPLQTTGPAIFWFWVVKFCSRI